MAINKSLTINKSNTLVKSSYKLTLRARQLIEISIAKVSWEKGIPETIEITADEFSSAFPDIKQAESYKELNKASDDLYEQSIDLIAPEKEARARFRWVDGVKYFDGEGRVELDFTKWVKPYLTELKNDYTKYRLLDIGRLNSAHAIRLYELLMQFQETGFRVDKLDSLKELFGVQENYKRWVDFDKYVLKPSIKNINDSSNWKVIHKPIKKGRKIDRVEFRFAPKSEGLNDGDAHLQSNIDF